jgi:hypothetical protein
VLLPTLESYEGREPIVSPLLKAKLSALSLEPGVGLQFVARLSNPKSEFGIDAASPEQPLEHERPF